MIPVNPRANSTQFMPEFSRVQLHLLAGLSPDLLHNEYSPKTLFALVSRIHIVGDAFQAHTKQKRVCVLDSCLGVIVGGYKPSELNCYWKLQEHLFSPNVSYQV